MIEFTLTDSSLGRALVACSSDGVCAVLIGDDDTALVADVKRRFPDAAPGSSTRLTAVARDVARVLDDPRAEPRPAMDLHGTSFQKAVWTALREIPPGETRSYAAVAQRIGRPGSVRAVAQACGANAVAVLVPCHRVVRSDGGISGYRWGVERKRLLLARERT